MYCILRTAKLKTIGAVASSGNHTFRERPTVNADTTRRGLNRSLGAACAADLVQQVRARLPVQRRRDSVLCIEYLVTAGPEFFAPGQTRGRYFNAALNWIKGVHGAENVVSACLHMDETTPHLVAYAVPISPTGRLSAKHFLGGRRKLAEMQTRFHAEVGKGFGLERGRAGSKATHREVKSFYSALSESAELPVIGGLDHLAAAIGLTTKRHQFRETAVAAALKIAAAQNQGALRAVGREALVAKGEAASLAGEIARDHARTQRLARELETHRRAADQAMERAGRMQERIGELETENEQLLHQLNTLARAESFDAEGSADAPHTHLEEKHDGTASQG